MPTDLRMRPDPVGTGGLPPNLRPGNPGGSGTGKSSEPSDAEIATAKAAFETTRLKGAEQLAAVVARIGEKQRRDPLVVVLRDGLARIEPFVSKPDFKKGLNAALDELASKGLEKGFVKLIELAIGKTAGEVKRPDTSVPPTGTKPDEAPGEHIVTKDVPIGDGKGNDRFVFDGARAKVAPGQPMVFKVWTPARWSLKNKRWDDTRVIVAAKAGAKGSALPSVPFRKKGANEVKLTAPDAPGLYVLYIEAAGIRETSPEYEFEVSAGPGAPAGAKAAAAQPASSARPAAGQRRIDITFVNRSDQYLKYWGADKMKVTFEQKPPDTLKPGASATFAIVAKGADEIAFGLMYGVVAKADAVAGAGTPMWTPHLTIPAGTTVMVAGSDVVPDILGLKSSENAATDAVSFVLSGKTVASAQPPAAGAELRIPITFTNDSNMVLRFFGADKMALAFEGRLPDVIKPGKSATFVARGKRDSELHFGLMYSILGSDIEAVTDETPSWMPHFDLPQGGAMMATCDLTAGTDGLGAAGRPDKGGAIFSLSGKWTKENQELKTRISIENKTRYKLRLVESSAAPGRFNPAPPAEIAPGTTLLCASWAKADSVQKAVYELEAADGAAGAGKGSRKPRRWTIGWQTKHPGFPVPNSQVENIELRGGDWQIYGIDLVKFWLDIKSDAKTK